jgi:hypothetical protein
MTLSSGGETHISRGNAARNPVLLGRYSFSHLKKSLSLIQTKWHIKTDLNHAV